MSKIIYLSTWTFLSLFIRKKYLFKQEQTYMYDYSLKNIEWNVYHFLDTVSAVIQPLYGNERAKNRHIYKNQALSCVCPYVSTLAREGAALKRNAYNEIYLGNSYVSQRRSWNTVSAETWNWTYSVAKRPLHVQCRSSLYQTIYDTYKNPFLFNYKLKKTYRLLFGLSTQIKPYSILYRYMKRIFCI